MPRADTDPRIFWTVIFLDLRENRIRVAFPKAETATLAGDLVLQENGGPQHCRLDRAYRGCLGQGHQFTEAPHA